MSVNLDSFEEDLNLTSVLWFRRFVNKLVSKFSIVKINVIILFDFLFYCGQIVSRRRLYY
jgi:hypothetical protein